MRTPWADSLMREGPQCPDEDRGTEAAPTLGKSNVEAEFDDVSILHDVILAFDPQLAGFARFRE